MAGSVLCSIDFEFEGIWPISAVIALGGASSPNFTAGASAPDILVEDAIEALRGLGPVELTTLPGVAKDMSFKLPAELNEGNPARPDRRMAPI
jgi:hypothetical protein